MSLKKQENTKVPRWNPGRLFAIPLKSGEFGVVQTLSSLMVNIVDCAVFDARFKSIPNNLEATDDLEVIGVLSTWKKVISKGDWKHVGQEPLVLDPKMTTNCLLVRKQHAVGLKTYDAGIIEEFLSAYHGLLPWNVNIDPEYFDGLLLPSISRPDSVDILPNDKRDEYRNARG